MDNHNAMFTPDQVTEYITLQARDGLSPKYRIRIVDRVGEWVVHPALTRIETGVVLCTARWTVSHQRHGKIAFDLCANRAIAHALAQALDDIHFTDDDLAAWQRGVNRPGALRVAQAFKTALWEGIHAPEEFGQYMEIEDWNHGED